MKNVGKFGQKSFSIKSQFVVALRSIFKNANSSVSNNIDLNLIKCRQPFIWKGFGCIKCVLQISGKIYKVMIPTSLFSIFTQVLCT